jgi:glucose-1-phosphate adenylyltransferase
VLVLVLAGGAGSRLGLLTRNRAKPAVPYAGHYRLVDVVLSNCHHSGLSEVWLTQQTNPVSLSDHLNGGRPWDLDRTRGGLLVLAPREDKTTGKSGFSRGTADVLWRHTELIREFAPSALVVVSSDAVYALDYQQVVRTHLEHDADVTMVTTRVEPDDASRYGVVQVDGGRVTDYAYKPDEPASDLVTNEVFVFTPTPVLDLLDELGGRRARTACPTSATSCCPCSWTAAGPGSTGWTATGATSAPSTRTGRPTWTCSTTSPRSTRATSTGR